ncbi:MAG: hypothetical protein ACJ749_00715, partial [Flavisolibacter sp.]
MESLENKIIADKLNSLRELPEHYSPNISSKWEIIQSGLTKKSPVDAAKKWLAGLLFLLCIAIAFWMIYPARLDQSHTSSTNVGKAEVEKEQDVIMSAQPKIDHSIIEQKNIQKSKRHLPAVKNNSAIENGLRKPALIITQRLPLIPDSVTQVRKDTMQYHSPIAIMLTKPKQKIYQKDFEGIVSPADAIIQKTAQKSFQVKFNFGGRKDVETGRQPSLRLQAADPDRAPRAGFAPA